MRPPTSTAARAVVVLALLVSSAIPRAQQAATEAPEYGPAKGTLVIVGGGNLNGSGINEKFIELAGEIGRAHV